MENETLPISEDLLEEEEDVAECAPCEQTSPTKKTHNVFTETMKMLNMVPVMVEVGSPKGLVVRTAPTDLCKRNCSK